MGQMLDAHTLRGLLGSDAAMTALFLEVFNTTSNNSHSFQPGGGELRTQRSEKALGCLQITS